MRSLRLSLALGLAALAGCGGGAPSLASVKGQVRFRGEPLRGGTIVFVPDAERGGRGPLAFAEVKLDGSFELRTGDKTGCISGWHRVTVAGAHLPDRYRDPELSGQRVEVRAGPANTCDVFLD